ncbi:helix-turn-helix domain-containing protein [Flavobacterium granuli]|uniref:AraC-like DNA-binding protein n=1 Tax=Flavobacterium granuli TaxID=280093 RepID=A0ABU1RX28_9FLAO|nr:helix-turn-helix domain-containing protein [Flavobacterium granuli]MDR6843323.1 AraC-like DNA-binding protein [Flavobacterium granuli]
MLFEMATGNLTFRLQWENQNNELDELAVMLNTLAGKMELLTSQFGYINPHYTYQSLVQTTIILDKNFIIKSFSAQVPILLEYNPDKLLEIGFHKILSKQSIPIWDIIKTETLANITAHATVQLIFITQSQHLVPSFCTVSKLFYSNQIIISTITTILQDILPESTEASHSANQPQDALLIENVRTYILKNLENPLPSTNELSKIFNINEFKLKDSFRHFFHTSIYQFYTEERLKKAHLLILQTTIPLKEIAFISGYNDYTNFYKAFKKRYNYPPSELKRHTSDNNNNNNTAKT